jgi:TAG lipase/lysophosphatidylethanolamine acyltransferase
MVRNLGGINTRSLYETCAVGTKDLISDYTSEVVRQLHFVCDAKIEGFTLEKKYDFFNELRQSYGRSALLLSGGGSLGMLQHIFACLTKLGMYHIGVIKALFEAHLIPKIISGASVGSVVASFLCITRDEDIPQFFDARKWNLDVFEHSGSVRRKLVRLLRKGKAKM